MTQAEWIYDSMMGDLETPMPGIEDEFAEGKICERLYREIYEANLELCRRLGREEDADVEKIINNFFEMNRLLCVHMYHYGVRDGLRLAR